MASERHGIDVSLLQQMAVTVSTTHAANEGGAVKYRIVILYPLEYKVRIECIISHSDGSEKRFEHEYDLLSLFEIPRP